jgi:hypothetical protein
MIISLGHVIHLGISWQKPLTTGYVKDGSGLLLLIAFGSHGRLAYANFVNGWRCNIGYGPLIEEKGMVCRRQPIHISSISKG